MKNLLKVFKNLRFYNILQQKEFAQAEQELNILQHDLKNAKAFLKKQKKNLFKNKSNIPRYIVIGASRSGKTTLLAQSGLGLIDVNQLPLLNVAPTKNCSWWFTADGIYLDTAGIYTKPDIERPRDELVWTSFIKALKRHFGKNPLQGVIIALDLPAISQDKALLQQTLFYVRDRLYEIARFAAELPIYIVFTKCDLISGFTTFFEDLDLEQRNQICGIDFTAEYVTSDPTQEFNCKFDTLLKQLSKHLISRLHHERKIAQRMLISNFPLQFECLRPVITEVLNKIPFGANIKLRGIFFTSSVQEGQPIDYLKTPLQNIIDFTANVTSTPEPQSNTSFFTAELFKKFITHSQKKFSKESLIVWLQYGLFGCAAGIILLSSLYFWHTSYQDNIKAIKIAQTALQSTTNLDDFAKLKSLTEQLDRSTKSPGVKYGINQISSLNNKIKQIYQTVSINSYIYQAQQAIETELNTANTASNPRSLYDDLKMYLMLGNPQKLDPDFTKQWFHDYATIRFPNDLEKQLKIKEAIATILAHNIKIKTDPKIIASAQQTFQNMPQAQLLFLLLENKFGAHSLPLDTDKYTELFVNFAFNIPDLYTAANFNKIFKTEIPNIVANPKLDDWILGDKISIQIDSLSKEQLITSLQNLYLENYANIWSNSFKNLLLQETKDFAQLTHQAELLAEKNSALIQLLKLLKDNTQFKGAPTQLTQLVAAKLQNLTSVDLNLLQNNLTPFANYLTTINRSPDLNKAVFAATASRFQDSSKHDPISLLQNYAMQQPKPLQTWLLALTTSTWRSLLETTRTYIITNWKSNIYPQFQQLAENKYPVFNDSKIDISLVDFNKVFGPNGLIDGFFNIYIKPFVDTDQMYWTWKEIDGQRINFSQTTLEIFIRSALIQKMYYPNGAIKPTARFTLTPLDMTANTKSFSLNLEGQSVTYKKGSPKVDQLTWPGSVPGSVTIEFINKDGKRFTTSFSGPWAWFKLLEKTNMHTINNAQHFELTFDLNGNAIKYELITAEAVSPFIPQIVTDFRCPESL